MNFSEVRYQPEKSGVYLGSPSIIRLEDGVLIASHDYFEKENNREIRISEIYRSEDDGSTWLNVNHLSGAFWGTLFICGGSLYHISIRCEYGDVVIRRSTDNGYSWTFPKDEKSGLLFKAGPELIPPNYHFGGATPVFIHNGRIYKACENLVQPESDRNCGWRADYFRAAVISAPVDADLLDAASWTMSNEVAFDYRKLNQMRPGLAAETSGWLEGNVLMGLDGRLHSVMRIHLEENNKAAILSLSEDGRKLEFDYSTGITDFPGGASKFTIRQDPVTGLYFTISNPVLDPEFPSQRNVLTISASKNLRDWRELKILLTDDTGLDPQMSARLTGFQYVDWQFDGDDLIYLVRMGYRGAHNFHDSNRITYHCLKNFRSLL